VQSAKIGPNRLLETEWVKDSILKEKCFVLFAGSGVAGDQQWTYHHPIGETSLEESEWVATPTRDISFLLQRRESEALSAWKRRSELAKRQQVLTARKGRGLDPDGQTEVWSFEGAPPVQPTVRSCMAAAKAAGKQESEWLSYADQAVRVAEQSFKEALRTQAVPEEWLRANARPTHETMGGPLGSNPQKAVPYLKGLTLAAAKDKVIRVAIGIDTADTPKSAKAVIGDDPPVVRLPQVVQPSPVPSAPQSAAYSSASAESRSSGSGHSSRHGHGHRSSGSK
jgi:hypothetical protein